MFQNNRFKKRHHICRTLNEFQPVVASRVTPAVCLITTVLYRQDCYFTACAVWIKHFNIHFIKVVWPPQFFRQSKSYLKFYSEEPTQFFSFVSFCMSWPSSSLDSWHYMRSWPSFIKQCDYSWLISFLDLCTGHFRTTVCTLQLMICMCYNSEVPKHEISLWFEGYTHTRKSKDSQTSLRWGIWTKERYILGWYERIVLSDLLQSTCFK